MALNNNSTQVTSESEKILTVSEYLNFLNVGLRGYRAKVIGEVSKVDFGPTGNVYFSLKDEKDQSILKSMIYKDRYDIYGVKLEEGSKIIAQGYPNIHKLYSFSFIAEVIEYSGEGLLRKEYEKLKKKLTEEGLFSKERKRSIPLYPQKIGVVTSLTGAVIADFSNNLGKFGFIIKMTDSRVDGQGAVADLLLSIRTLKKQDIEVLVIMRGGGSLESLMPMMPFNNEALIREIVGFPVPVIVGIGHHKDVPLLALAADLEVSTPSIAATTLTQSWNRATALLEKYTVRVVDSYEDDLNDANLLINRVIATISEAGDLILEKYETIKNQLRVSFQSFKNAILNAKIGIRDSLDKSLSGFKSLLSRVDQRVREAEKIVILNNPLRQLRLGYSIATSNGKIVRRTADTKIGARVDLKVVDGLIVSEVKTISKQ